LSYIFVEEQESVLEAPVSIVTSNNTLQKKNDSVIDATFATAPAVPLSVDSSKVKTPSIAEILLSITVAENTNTTEIQGKESIIFEAPAALETSTFLPHKLEIISTKPAMSSPFALPSSGIETVLTIPIALFTSTPASEKENIPLMTVSMPATIATFSGSKETSSVMPAVTMSSGTILANETASGPTTSLDFKALTNTKKSNDMHQNLWTTEAGDTLYPASNISALLVPIALDEITMPEENEDLNQKLWTVAEGNTLFTTGKIPAMLPHFTLEDINIPALMLPLEYETTYVITTPVPFTVPTYGTISEDLHQNFLTREEGNSTFTTSKISAVLPSFNLEDTIIPALVLSPENETTTVLTIPVASKAIASGTISEENEDLNQKLLTTEEEILLYTTSESPALLLSFASEGTVIPALMLPSEYETSYFLTTPAVVKSTANGTLKPEPQFLTTEEINTLYTNSKIPALPQQFFSEEIIIPALILSIEYEEEPEHITNSVITEYIKTGSNSFVSGEILPTHPTNHVPDIFSGSFSPLSPSSKSEETKGSTDNKLFNALTTEKEIPGNGSAFTDSSQSDKILFPLVSNKMLSENDVTMLNVSMRDENAVPPVERTPTILVPNDSQVPRGSIPIKIIPEANTISSVTTEIFKTDMTGIFSTSGKTTLHAKYDSHQVSPSSNPALPFPSDGQDKGNGSETISGEGDNTLSSAKTTSKHMADEPPDLQLTSTGRIPAITNHSELQEACNVSWIVPSGGENTNESLGQHDTGQISITKLPTYVTEEHNKTKVKAVNIKVAENIIEGGALVSYNESTENAMWLENPYEDITYPGIQNEDFNKNFNG
jgi:hypothetical protein